MAGWIGWCRSYLLSDLTPATVYHLRLAARTSRGQGPSTDMIQLQTIDYGMINTARLFICLLLYVSKEMKQSYQRPEMA